MLGDALKLRVVYRILAAAAGIIICVPAALMTGEHLGERAARGSWKKFERVLKKVRERGQPPVPGDEL